MIGRQISHYKVVSRLGSGGMGDVYAAEDLRLGRTVALKLLPRDRAVDHERFHHEARLLASLNHPNIVTLFAVEEEENLRFLVMERVDGAPLDHQIPEQGMSVERLLELAVALAEAVAAAHQKGIVHRDLKPRNIMVDTEGRLKVLDFGLAQPLPEGPEDDQEVTATTTEVSKVAGTVPYMAPETLKGLAGDHRGDIFSLGVILYQMASGRRPFTGGTTIEVSASIIRDDPPRLSSLRQDLPAGLDETIFHCLAKDPDERYDSTEELVHDLHRLRDGLEPSTLDNRLSGLFATVPNRRRTLRRVLLWAGLATAVAGGLTFFDDEVESATPERRLVAVLPFENLGPESEDYFALGITEEITSRLASVRDIGVIARSSTTGFADSSMSAAEIGRELQADYVLTGSVRWDGAGDSARVRITPRLVQAEDATQIWSDTYEKVLEDIFAVQTQIAVEVTDQLNVTLFPTERRALESRSTSDFEAYRAYLEGQEEAANILRPDSPDWAVELLTQAVEKDPLFVEAWAQLAWTHATLYHFGLDRTPDRREAAEVAIRRALELDPSSPEARLAKANVLYWTQRDYPGALQELRLARRRAPNDHRIIEAEGFILRRLGHFDDSLDRLQDAARLNPLSSHLRREIATSLYLMRRYDESIEAYDEAIQLSKDPVQELLYKARTLWTMGLPDLARKALGDLPTDLRSPMRTRYEALTELYSGNPEQALVRARQATAPFFQWTSTEAPFALLEGEILTHLGREAEARERYTEALKLIDERLEEAPDEARLLASRGLTQARLGLREQALRDGWKSVELKPLEADTIDGAHHRLHLAKILTVAGEHAAALDEIELLLSVPSRLSRPLLRLDPAWEPLRGDPRFERILRESP